MLNLGNVIIDKNGNFEKVYVNSMQSSITVDIDFWERSPIGYVNVQIKDGGRTTKERIEIIEKSVIDYLKTRPGFYYEKTFKVLCYSPTEEMHGCKSVAKKPSTHKRVASKPTTRKIVRK